MAEPECGITKFLERDINLLMAEELRVNAAFSRWVMGHFDLAERLEHPAEMTTVSKVEDGTEIDVLAWFRRKDGGLHALYEEDKIDATEMPQQLQRYVRQGANDHRRGRANSFSVLAFTPRRYCFADVPDGVRQISLEDAASWLRSSDGGARAAYRASLLEQSLPISGRGARDANVAQTDPYIREWWDRVYEQLNLEMPGYFSHRTLYPRSVYFAPEILGQARYLRVDFKGHKGEVDLAFKNFDFLVISQFVATQGDCPGFAVKNGKSAALRINGLEPFVISDGFGIIETRVMPAYRAARDLLEYWKAYRSIFDAMPSLVP